MKHKTNIYCKIFLIVFLFCWNKAQWTNEILATCFRPNHFVVSEKKTMIVPDNGYCYETLVKLYKDWNYHDRIN